MKTLLFDACDILYHRPLYDSKLDAFFGPGWRKRQQQNAAGFKNLHQQAARGKLSVQQLFDGILEIYNWPSDRLDEGRRFLHETMADVEFFDGVCTSLHQLKADGFKLAIITNSFQSQETKLEWFASVGIEHIWDAFICSSQTGLFKPEPEIYLEALRQVQSRPDEAAFIAHAANELEGAKTVGLTTIAFNRDDESVRADHIIEHFAQLVDLATGLRSSSTGPKAD